MTSVKHTNGYASEAPGGVINNLFEYGVDRIIAKHHIDNPASGKVMEKCGMRFTDFSKAHAKFGSDKQCDVKCYELNKQIKTTRYNRVRHTENYGLPRPKRGYCGIYQPERNEFNKNF